MEGFLKLIPVGPSTSKKQRYTALIDAAIDADHNALFSFIHRSPHVLALPIDTEHYGFDFIYDVAVHGCMHPKHEDVWMNELYNCIELLGELNEYTTAVSTIKSKKYYLLFCQKDSRNMYDLFGFLYDNDFEVEPIESLVLSLVARGELPKLQRIAENYSFDDVTYSSMMATAVRFGRIDVLLYLMTDHEINPADCGNLLTFEHYNHSDQRFMYYRKRICDEREADNVFTYGPVHGTVQDYVACVTTILEVTTVHVSVETIDVWCSFMSKKVYSWDVVPVEVLHILKAKLKKPLPFDHDFGVYTTELIGHTLGNRSHLVQDYLRLQERYDELHDTFERLLYNHRLLKEQYSALRHAKPVVRRRVRCITE